MSASSSHPPALQAVLSRVRVPETLHNTTVATFQTYLNRPETTQLHQLASDTAGSLLQLAARPGENQKQIRNQLVVVSKTLVGESQRRNNSLCLSLVLASLSISGDDLYLSRSVASAVATNLKGGDKENRTIIGDLVHALLQVVGAKADLKIVTFLAQSANVTCRSRNDEKCVAEIVRAVFSTHTDPRQKEHVKAVSSALSLVTQLRPWNDISPVELVDRAVEFNLWHGAQELCQSSQNKPAVLALIEYAMQEQNYRRADYFATHFYTLASERYLEARYLHACSTISKVIAKGALAVIEKQIERVDRAMEKVQSSGSEVLDIRKFALGQLAETGNMEAAQRLAGLWDMDFSCDEDALRKVMEARRQKYLQWDEALPNCDVPVEISDPDTLRASFEQIRRDGHVFGFDCEWGETFQVALLQIASTKRVLLIDIPGLSRSEQGTKALEETAGALFASTDDYVVGFSCRQDLACLMKSPCSRDTHWFADTHLVVDLKTQLDPSFRDYGLARCCEHFVGKPLDKSEQCSAWQRRPLTQRQRIYAALDAFVCAKIYHENFFDKSRPRQSNSSDR